MQTCIESIQVAVEKDRLSGTVLAPAPALPGVLFVHGWGGHQRHDLARAREAAALGCVCMTFDLRGHEATSERSDTVTRQHNLDDLIAAFDTLVARTDVDPDAIAVVGLSYGGYLASLLTRERNVRWLALRSPALYRDQDWNLPKLELHRDGTLMAYRSMQHAPDSNRALAAAAQFAGDVLLVEAGEDRIVPHAVIASFRHAFSRVASLTWRTIAGADHAMSDKASQREYGALLIRWLMEMIGGARSLSARERIREHQQGSVPTQRPPPSAVADG